MSENMYNWGPRWKDSPFSWTPRGVRELMRDEMGMTLAQIAVMEVLVSFRESADTYLSWASIETLADRMGTSYFTARRAIKELTKRGLLREHAAPRRGKARTYDLHRFLMLLAEGAERAEETKKEKMRVVR